MNLKIVEAPKETDEKKQAATDSGTENKDK